MNNIQRVEIPRFIEKIELSKHRRAKYFNKNDNIPKKYNSDEFIFKDNTLINTITNKRVIKNIITAGTPNVKIITGQYYWQGANPHVRRKIKREMSLFFCPFLSQFNKIKSEEYPIGIRIDLYDSLIDGTQQDLDNFIFVYRKVIHDVLVDKYKTCKKIIEDDSKEYIRDIPSKYYPIENHGDRKLVVELYSLNK